MRKPNSILFPWTRRFLVTPNSILLTRARRFLVTPNSILVPRARRFLVTPNSILLTRARRFLVTPNSILVPRARRFLVTPNSILLTRARCFLVTPNSILVPRTLRFLVTPNSILFPRARCFLVTPNSILFPRARCFFVTPNSILVPSAPHFLVTWSNSILDSSARRFLVTWSNSILVPRVRRFLVTWPNGIHLPRTRCFFVTPNSILAPRARRFLVTWPNNCCVTELGYDHTAPDEFSARWKNWPDTLFTRDRSIFLLCSYGTLYDYDSEWVCVWIFVRLSWPVKLVSRERKPQTRAVLNRSKIRPVGHVAVAPHFMNKSAPNEWKEICCFLVCLFVCLAFPFRLVRLTLTTTPFPPPPKKNTTAFLEEINKWITFFSIVPWSCYYFSLLGSCRDVIGTWRRIWKYDGGKGKIKTTFTLCWITFAPARKP